LEFANQLEKGKHLAVKIFAGSDFFEARERHAIQKPVPPSGQVGSGSELAVHSTLLVVIK
jgi:hypothetical protein